MRKIILRSTFVNCDAYEIARINCLSVHVYLIKYYWRRNSRNYIRNNLYCRNNKINKESIMEALTKWKD